MKIKYCRVIVSSAYFDGLQNCTPTKIFIDESCFFGWKTFRTSYITFYVFFLACESLFSLYLYIFFCTLKSILKVAPLGIFLTWKNISQDLDEGKGNGKAVHSRISQRACVCVCVSLTEVFPKFSPFFPVFPVPETQTFLPKRRRNYEKKSFKNKFRQKVFPSASRFQLRKVVHCV